MANTYTQLYVQIVFVVKHRHHFIKELFREEIEKYICGIISGNKSKPIAIYCNPDHTHVFVGLHPAVSVAEIARDIKSCSSKWINQERKTTGKFEWQDGYGAFSYSESHIDRVAKYILNQPNHHKKNTFKEEYLSFLKEYEISFRDEYLFDFFD